MTHPNMNLANFTGAGYERGRGILAQIGWLTVGPVFRAWWVPSAFRVTLLRAFGASIGKGVLIRHNVRIHWPWKLSIDDATWIGEGAWLLNLEYIHIGSNVCVSQDALLCTGSHNRRSESFEFDNASIEIGDRAWIAARAIILRGVNVGDNALIPAGTVVRESVDAGTVAE